MVVVVIFMVLGGVPHRSICGNGIGFCGFLFFFNGFLNQDRMGNYLWDIGALFQSLGCYGDDPFRISDTEDLSVYAAL